MPPTSDPSTLLPPSELLNQLPCPPNKSHQIQSWRNAIRDILSYKDSRLLVIVGPCSIHDPQAALIYAEKLANFANTVKDNLFIVMRSYFAKPRTRYGWKGWLNDPDLDGSGKIDKGIFTARQLLLQINDLNLPCGMELLNPYSHHYLTDLLSWAAIGARTTESQIHRELVSSINLPVGFKNTTSGNTQAAINAMAAAANQHHFVTINQQGRLTTTHSRGNQHTHLILRGGDKETNYDIESFATALKQQQQQGLAQRIIIDCSHGNSPSGEREQLTTLEYIQQQYLQETAFGGIMLESNLMAGRQSMQASMTLGQSITDPCLGWDETEKALISLSNCHNIQ